MLIIALVIAIPVSLVVGFFVGRNNPSLAAINNLLAKGKHIASTISVAVIEIKKTV